MHGGDSRAQELLESVRLFPLRALRFRELHFILEDIPLPKFVAKKRYLVPSRMQDMKEGISSVFFLSIPFFIFF